MAELVLELPLEEHHRMVGALLQNFRDAHELRFLVDDDARVRGKRNLAVREEGASASITFCGSLPGWRWDDSPRPLPRCRPRV